MFDLFKYFCSIFKNFNEFFISSYLLKLYIIKKKVMKLKLFLVILTYISITLNIKRVYEIIPSKKIKEKIFQVSLLI